MSRRRLALITTGGTIAGVGELSSYSAAALSAQSLFDAIPRLQELAEWNIVQAFALDSRDITPEHWITLAKVVQAQTDDPGINGVVITHGTDTLEETAFALDLLVSTEKPIVVTAAMRPATSLSADGPLNLVQATLVALHSGAENRGVLVVASDHIIQGRRVSKAHTHAPGAITARSGGDEGSIAGESITFWRLPCARVMLERSRIPAASLPRVDVFYASAGQCADLIDFMVKQGTKGIVLALTGHGSVPAAMLAALDRARVANIALVRASRIAHGGVFLNHNADDDANNWIPAWHLSPAQARVLLILALATGAAAKDISSLFQRIACGN